MMTQRHHLYSSKILPSCPKFQAPNKGFTRRATWRGITRMELLLTLEDAIRRSSFEDNALSLQKSNTKSRPSSRSLHRLASKSLYRIVTRKRQLWPPSFALRTI